jgi:hypothetical protein
LAGLAVAACLLWPATGLAGPGDGLQAGSLVVHPRLSLTGEYDTNVFRQAEGELGVADLSSAPILYIAPGLGIQTEDPQALDLNFDGELVWEQFFGGGNAIDSQTGLTGNAFLGAELNPNGGFSFTIENNFVHNSEEPTVTSASERNWFRNSLGGIIGIHPGDDILRIDLGYHWNINQYYFDSALDLDKQQHVASFDMTWRFLPKTAFILESDLEFNRYETPTRGVQGSGLRNVDSMPVNVKGGLSGLISRRLSTKLLFGWEWGIYESGPDYSEPIGRAQFAFNWGNLSLDNHIAVHYERSFDDSTLSNYYGSHEVGGEIQQNFFDKAFGLRAGAKYILRDYGDLNADTGPSGPNQEPQYYVVENRNGDEIRIPFGLNDKILNINAAIMSDFADWGSLELSYNFWGNFTNDSINIPTENVNSLREFQQHVVQLKATVKY